MLISNDKEIQRYNIKTGELETLTKQKSINGYLIFSAQQGRGLGMYDVYFLADLVEKSVKTLKIGSGIFPVGWLTKEKFIWWSMVLHHSPFFI